MVKPVKWWIDNIQNPIVAGERVSLKIEFDKPTPIGRNSQHVHQMLTDSPDSIPELLGVIGDVLATIGVVSRELPGVVIVPIETAAVRSNLEHARRVFKDGPDSVVTQAVRIIRDVLINDENCDHCTCLTRRLCQTR